jgi:ribonuclease BN (tRNA processing enzyme)
MQQATQGHMSLEAIGKTAAQAKVKTVVLSHLTQRFGSTDYTPWGDEVKKYFAGGVVIANDLMEF